MSRQTTAVAEVRSLIERVLDRKKQQDELAEDIREIYLEARKSGWNKTSIGQAVSIIRKRDKDAAAFDNVADDTAQYLQAYYGTGITIAPHAHEAFPPHDPETGEISNTERGEPRETVGGTAREAPIRQARSPADGRDPARGPSGTAATNHLRQMDEDTPEYLRRAG